MEQESLSASSRVWIPGTGTALTPWIHSVVGTGVCSGSQRIFSFRNAGAEESWAAGGSLRQGSMGSELSEPREGGQQLLLPAAGMLPVIPAIPTMAWTGMSCRVRTESWTVVSALSQKLE